MSRPPDLQTVPRRRSHAPHLPGRFPGDAQVTLPGYLCSHSDPGMEAVMRVLLLLLAICLGPEPAAAQRLEPSRFPHQVTARMPSPPNASARTPAPPATTATLALAGIFSGAVGLYLGSEVGGWIQRDSCQDCIEWRGVGAIGAESSAIPLAIHFANGRRGRVLPPWRPA